MDESSTIMSFGKGTEHWDVKIQDGGTGHILILMSSLKSVIADLKVHPQRPVQLTRLF